jgi:hypothetical protein
MVSSSLLRLNGLVLVSSLLVLLLPSRMGGKPIGLRTMGDNDGQAETHRKMSKAMVGQIFLLS